MIVEQEEEDVDLYVVDDGQEQPVFKHYPGEFQERLRHPLAEVLRYPYLLCHQELCKSSDLLHTSFIWNPDPVP